MCFGGADQFDLSSKAAQALLRIESIETIHVVLGGANKSTTLNAIQTESKKINIHRNLDEKSLCQLMKQCHIAIAPSSTILYEICSVKMPVLSGYYVENQKNIYQGLSDHKVIVQGGNFEHYSVADFENQIEQIVEGNQISKYVENQQKLFTGESKKFFLALVNRLSVSFRRAEEKDLMDVYDWSNDPDVRVNSYDSNPIKLEDHTRWFLKKIKDPNSIFLIALVNDKPGGIVRFEVGENHSVIGIVVAKEFRGQKLAKKFLEQSAKYYFETVDKPILAYIKKENKASEASFKKSGYKYVKDEMIKEYLSFAYKLEKEYVKE